jgi:hypothetical protein
MLSQIASSNCSFGVFDVFGVFVFVDVDDVFVFVDVDDDDAVFEKNKKTVNDRGSLAAVKLRLVSAVILRPSYR